MIRILTLGFLVIAAAPASAQSPQDVPVSDSDPIIVTGLRLDTTEKNLADCLARNCPPDEDIDASLAHAENLFIAGKYKDARQIALKSLERNRRHAGNYPVAVSDLNRAFSRIAAHLGEKDTYRKATVAIRDSLKQGLADDDPQIAAATLEMAKMYASIGSYDIAEANYRDARRKAEKIGRPDYIAFARVGEAQIDFARGYKKQGLKALRELAQDTRPELWRPRLRALVTLIQLEDEEARPAIQRQLAQVLADLGVSQPTLLYAPPIDLNNFTHAEGTTVSTTELLATRDFNDRWADLGFWVDSNGEVEDLTILRSNNNEGWLDPLLESIKGRRYTPSEAGGYRVERYTFTSFWRYETGSRIRQRSANARIEYLDLTDTPDAPPPEPSTPSSSG